MKTVNTTADLLANEENKWVTSVISFLAAGFFLPGNPYWRRFGSWQLLGSPLTLVLVCPVFRTFDQAMMVAGLGVVGLTTLAG